MDDGHLDVACSSLTLDGPVRAGHCSLALAGEHNPELVAEVVLEVYEAGVWIDVLRSMFRVSRLLSVSSGLVAIACSTVGRMFQDRLALLQI